MIPWFVFAAWVKWCFVGNVSEWLYWYCTISIMFAFTVSPQTPYARSVSSAVIWWPISVFEQSGSGFLCWMLHRKVSRRGPRSAPDRRASYTCSQKSWWVHNVFILTPEFVVLWALSGFARAVVCMPEASLLIGFAVAVAFINIAHFLKIAHDMIIFLYLKCKHMLSATWSKELIPLNGTTAF